MQYHSWPHAHLMLSFCLQPDYQPSKAAIFQFWGGLFGLAVYWIVMLVFAVSKPRYLILTIMALFFVCMNVLGYYRCRNWSSQMIKASQASGGFGNVMSGLTTGMAQNFMARLRSFSLCVMYHAI